jgi:DNA mismatch repair protein MutL
MCAKIKVLDEGVINRIAAGEVVERPASVVKELVENAIDAEATSIRVEIENGGRKLVRVRDNGVGMSRDDAFLALERHATSKLRSEKDLFSIATLGFRGEALASIASVSRLRLVTAEDSDLAGAEMIIEAGVLRKADQIGAGRGTLIEVRNLFYNVPVRRKFLKAAAIEGAAIQELVMRFAIAFPSVGFAYAEDGKVKIDAPPVRTVFERIHTLFSKDVRDNLAEVKYQVDDAVLQGYVARPPYARSNMRSVLTFVNRRAVRDRLINAAVTRSFQNLMERGRYPLAILFVTVPADQVDVNVHPQKAEVRFTRPKAIADLILDGVHQALMGAPFNPPAGPRESLFPRSPTTPVPRHLREDRVPEAESTSEHPFPQKTQESFPIRPVEPLRPMPPRTAPPPQQPELFSSLGIVGRMPGSFLVLHSKDELIIVDQHAAHERLLFDDLKNAELEGRAFPSQSMLIPKVLEYPAVEARALAAHLDALRNAGFRIEEFGENDFVVKGVPSWLGNADLDEFFSGLIDVMLNTGMQGDPGILRNELLKTMACKAAVKEPDRMHVEEMRGLLTALDRSTGPLVCPHGRPFVLKIPFDEIRKKMGRK